MLPGDLPPGTVWWAVVAAYQAAEKAHSWRTATWEAGLGTAAPPVSGPVVTGCWRGDPSASPGAWRHGGRSGGPRFPGQASDAGEVVGGGDEVAGQPGARQAAVARPPQAA